MMRFMQSGIGEDCLQTELWAILLSLKVAWDTGAQKIILESNSL